MQLVPVQFSGLEAELQTELKVTCVKCSASLSKSRITNTVVILGLGTWQFEICVIQDVETLSPELQVSFFSNLEILKERRVPRHETWASKGVAA